jgi:hypothetical protein
VWKSSVLHRSRVSTTAARRAAPATCQIPAPRGSSGLSFVSSSQVCCNSVRSVSDSVSVCAEVEVTSMASELLYDGYMIPAHDTSVNVSADDISALADFVLVLPFL